MNLSTIAKAAIALSSLSLILACAGLVISSDSKAEAIEQWQPLAEIISQQQLTQIVADNTAPSADRAEIAKSAVGFSKNDLLVVDFETPALCGRGGCAVAGYRLSTGEQILFTYAQQPAGKPIVEFVEREDTELPCLLIAPSLGTSARGLTRDTLCYRNDEWVTQEVMTTL